MPGLLPELIGTSPGLMNTLPKVLGSSILSGLMMLAGITQSTRPPSIWTVVRTLLPGLLIQFVIAPFFDFCVASTIPTNGHIWFLYSVALAQLLLLLVGRSQAMLVVTLAMCLCASPVWHAAHSGHGRLRICTSWVQICSLCEFSPKRANFKKPFRVYAHTAGKTKDAAVYTPP